MIYTYIGMHLRLHLGNVKYSERWLIEPVLFAPQTFFTAGVKTYSTRISYTELLSDGCN